MFWNKPSILIVAVLLILATIVLVPIGDSDVMESPFGSWKVEVTANYPDGTSEPLSVAGTYGQQLLDVMRNGVLINSFTITLKAEATGSGYPGCDLDMSQTYMDGYIWQQPFDYDDPQDCIWNRIYGPDETVIIPLNSGFQTVMEYECGMGSACIVGLENGDYKIEWRIDGSSKYRPTGTTDDWEVIFQDVDIIESGITISGNTPPPTCGDGICNGNEDCETCPEDCGDCPSDIPAPHAYLIDKQPYYHAGSASGDPGDIVRVNVMATLDTDDVTCGHEVDWEHSMGFIDHDSEYSNVWKEYDMEYLTAGVKDIKIRVSNEESGGGEWSDYVHIYVVIVPYGMTIVEASRIYDIEGTKLTSRHFSIENNNPSAESYYVDSTHYLGSN